MWYSWWQCVQPALDPSSMIAQSHLENRCGYSSMTTFNIQIRRAQHFIALSTYTHITQLPFWIWSEADGHKQCSCVYSKDGVRFRFCLSLGKLRWFPHNIRAIMAKIKLPKKPQRGNILNKDKKILSRSKLSSWPREIKLNLKISIFQLKRTFRVSWKHNNTRF